MEKYPVLEIDLEAIRQNSLSMNRRMNGIGLRVCGVIKVADGDVRVAEAYASGGCDQIGSSRVQHLKEIKEYDSSMVTMLVRIPMECEAEEVVRYADISLNSEGSTLETLDREAGRLGKTHSVLIMLDCGDKREGAEGMDELVELCLLAERLPNLKLLGIGTNWGCVSGVEPDQEKLDFLAESVRTVEKTLGRKLEMVSGGNSSLLLWIYEGKALPPEINHIRAGGTIANPITFRINRGIPLEGRDEHSFRLKAQIAEIKVRDMTLSGGGRNWRGDVIAATNGGPRRRAIIDLGSADIGNCHDLMPVDTSIEVTACSSDHTVLDITDCEREYKVGDIIEFAMKYSALMNASYSRHVSKKYID